MASSENVKVRKAEKHDIPLIMDFLLRAHEEDLSELNLPDPIESDLLNWVVQVYTAGVCYVAEVDGTVIGSFGGLPNTFPWNRKQPYLGDMWFYVIPEMRQAGGASALFKAIKKISRKYNTPMVLGIMSGKTQLKLFYQQQGMTHTGGIFIFGFHEEPD